MSDFNNEKFEADDAGFHPMDAARIAYIKPTGLEIALEGFNRGLWPSVSFPQKYEHERISPPTSAAGGTHQLSTPQTDQLGSAARL